MIWITLGLEWTADFVGSASLPPGAVLLVFDSEGTVVTRSLDLDRWVGRTVAPRGGLCHG